MITDITIGQYYASNSLVHKLDARTKILGSIIFMIALFQIDSLLGYIPIGLFIFASLKIAKIPFRYILKGLRPLAFIIVLAFLLNTFLYKGEHLIFELGFIKVYLTGLYRAFFMAARIVLLVISTSLLTLTTTPIELTDGLESLMSPFKMFKFPAHEIAMMMSISLRYIPILLDEMNKIIKAQMARGADFETGSLTEKARNLIPVLVPLFISSFKRADELAIAMEARCYRGGDNRTKLKVPRYGKSDAIAFICIFALLLICILV